MADMVRAGLSLERNLLKQFDKSIERKGYTNRSEAIRDLIREQLLSEEISRDRVVVGTVTMVYDHHRPGLTERLIEAQHQALGKVLAVTHVHMDHDNCLEVIILKGRPRQLQALADHLLSLKGVKNGKLVISTTARSY